MPPVAQSIQRKFLLAALCALIVAGAAAYLFLRQGRHRAASRPALPAAFADRMPRRVLWAWEEPENLQALPPTAGVAYLAETVLIGDHLTILPRRQPLVPAIGAPVMAVVRIETRPGFADTPGLRTTTALQLAAVATRGSLRAMQIDFDATQSQQAFYRGVLEALHPQLPPSMPLSITALVSWCGANSWLDALPIDEAVPMFFRMGGPRALAGRDGRISPIVEPLCRTSIGLATDEPWPRTVAAQDAQVRVYLFAPAPWRPRQLAAVATTPLASLAEELAR